MQMETQTQTKMATSVNIKTQMPKLLQTKMIMLAQMKDEYETVDMKLSMRRGANKEEDCVIIWIGNVHADAEAD